jgi:ribosome modulation factor
LTISKRLVAGAEEGSQLSRNCCCRATTPGLNPVDEQREGLQAEDDLGPQVCEESLEEPQLRRLKEGSRSRERAPKMTEQEQRSGWVSAWRTCPSRPPAAEETEEEHVREAQGADVESQARPRHAWEWKVPGKRV